MNNKTGVLGQEMEFIEAAEMGDLERVKELLKAGVDVHAPCRVGLAGYDSALKKAAARGRLEIVKELLKAGADVHADHDGVVEYAARSGNVDVMCALLEAGCREDAPMAFETAASLGHTRIMHLLIGGVDKGKQIPKAFFLAAYHGRINAMKLLLQEASWLSVRVFDDYLLRDAVRRGHYKVAEILLGSGADVHAQNDYCLATALKNEDAPMIALLEEAAEKKKAAKEKYQGNKIQVATRLAPVVIERLRQLKEMNNISKAKIIEKAIMHLPLDCREGHM